MYKGIDISSFNGIIDWQKLKKEGKARFAIQRCVVGWNGEVDTACERNLAAANGVGIPIGLYTFCYAINEAEARKEAQKTLSIARRYKIEYPIAYDFEEDSINTAKKRGVTLTSDLASAIVNAFCDEIRKGGYFPVYYTNLNYIYNGFLHNIKADLWLAQINVGAPGRDCDMWQYSWVGKYAGINSDVDEDIDYIGFPEYLKAHGYNNLKPDPWIEQSSKWAKEAVDWAVRNGIIEGAGGDNYGLKKPITKEQMATILYRFYKKFK